MSKVLIYSGSLGPNLNKNKSIAVKFEYPLNVSQVKIVPHARVCHEKFRQISKTSPSHFELDVFGRDTNQPSLSVYKRLGALKFKETSQLEIKDFLTDILIFRGDYDYISVNVYSKENNEIIENIKTDEANEDEIETIQQSKSTFVALNTQVDEYGDVETDNDSLVIVYVLFR
uniref:Protein virilizer (Trinotate prediction) n=1 Tax=Henneguya salminicola TaxID=69463 RepID=A0A6G3MGI2_HENSL